LSSGRPLPVGHVGAATSPREGRRGSYPNFSFFEEVVALSIATNAGQSTGSMRQIASNRIRQIVRNFIVATFWWHEIPEVVVIAEWEDENVSACSPGSARFGIQSRQAAGFDARLGGVAKTGKP
jgi:hypothetical protein